MTPNQKLFKYESSVVSITSSYEFDSHLIIQKVNWYQKITPNVDSKRFGIYTYEGEDIIDVTWYKSENERDDEIERRDTI